MQQHDDRLRAKAAAEMRVVRRKNILKMLGTRASLAIKKTVFVWKLVDYKFR